MPAYNEAPTIEAVLDDLYPRIDRLIIVDDGSTDATPDIIDRWAGGRDRSTVIHFPANHGLSAALRAGWDELRAMLARGEVRPNDVAFSIDADGQHEPGAIDGMIAHLVDHHFDCVIGSRDLSYHTGYKRFGNAVMTWIGRFAGGQRFEDIECGYRVFRVRPLLEAQEFYRGYKYSETVEVAVILARMGYRVDNAFPIDIPVARTRTRLFDAAVDAVCMPLAWYRLACWRVAPAGHRTSFTLWLPVAVLAVTVVALVLMLLKPFYLGDDSAHSYAHVWYLSESLFTRHEWPWHVAQLENGDGVMFPYGIVPWLPDALLHPIFGDWIVTASMVAGVCFLVAGLLQFRTAMRNPLLLALFFLNPLLWNGITQFQLATIWSFGFFFFAIAQFERRRYVLAAPLLGFAIAVHPMMGAGALLLFGAWELVRTRRVPWRLVAVTIPSAILASPAIWLFLSTPSIREANHAVVALSALDNLRRLSIVAFALVLPAATPFVYRHQRAVAGGLAGATALLLSLLPPSGLWERSHPRFAAYLAEHPIEAGAHYRVMVKNNHEDGMVEFMRAGAVLANEFFTESVHRQEFSGVDAYECFLATKNIDHVVLSGEYKRKFYLNESGLLGRLVALGDAEREFTGADGTLAYRVRPSPAAKRDSISDCHL